MIEDLYDFNKQMKFVDWMKKRGWSPSYQQRIITDGKAAINFALKRNELRRAPRIISIENANGGRYDWTFTTKQLGKLFDSLDEDTHEHVFRYLIIRLNTGCRQNAAFDLTPRQVHLADPHSWLNLNPPDHNQTNKRRPKLPVTETLKPWLKYWSQPENQLCHKPRQPRPEPSTPFVNWYGDTVSAIKGSWLKLRNKAGLPKIAQPRAIRHTVATWLYSHDVPDRQIAIFLGHDETNAEEGARFDKMSRHYRHLKPSYCATAKCSIEGLLHEIQSHCLRNILSPEIEVY